MEMFYKMNLFIWFYKSFTCLFFLDNADPDQTDTTDDRVSTCDPTSPEHQISETMPGEQESCMTTEETNLSGMQFCWILAFLNVPVIYSINYEYFLKWEWIFWFIQLCEIFQINSQILQLTLQAVTLHLLN